MKPAPFEYYAPTTVDEAVGLLAELGDDAKILAGGQSLVPMLNMRLARFDGLIDVGRIAALRSIDRTDGTVTVGAMVPQCEIEESEWVARDVPLLAAATPLIGHFQIRNRGTVGGSIAHADPAAEYPAVALTLGAEMDVAAKGRSRTIPASDFFTGVWSTALEPDELLVATRFPTPAPHSGFAVEEVARRHGDFAIAGATVAITLDGSTISHAAIGLFGMAGTPTRGPAAEAALVGAAADGIDEKEIGRLAIDGLDPPEDLHASSDLRARIATTVVARAVKHAIEEATHA